MCGIASTRRCYDVEKNQIFVDPENIFSNRFKNPDSGILYTQRKTAQDRIPL